MHYKFSKRTLSQYVRTACRRRLRLDLINAGPAPREPAPKKGANRPGLALLAEQGRTFEREKFKELEIVFPDDVVRGDYLLGDDEEKVFQTIKLRDCLERLRPGSFALEAEYEVVESFRTLHGIRSEDLVFGNGRDSTLLFSDVRPDIVMALGADGSERREIRPDGAMVPVGTSDDRTGLRIIDIKSSGRASVSHFAELAYYGMTLSAWLDSQGVADRFFVMAEAAIWHGKHEGSAIAALEKDDRKQRRTSGRDRYLAALETDLETMPPEVVCTRVARFFARDLREVLAEPDWRRLPLHIGHRCQGCDYLGYSWTAGEENPPPPTKARREIEAEQATCWQVAENDGHLSRVKGLTEGACGKLLEARIEDVVALSGISAGNPVFERHQALKASRTVLRHRAKVLSDSEPATIPDRAGTSALMPRQADIRVALSADYDIGSGLTFAFGYRIEWFALDHAGRVKLRIEQRPMLVESQHLAEERDIFCEWLRLLAVDLGTARVESEALRQHRAERRTEPTVQFYIWDRLTYDHLKRVMGRHLLAVQSKELEAAKDVDIAFACWLLPAEQTLEDADFVGRESPITIVSDVINSILAAPIPHHYSIVDIANTYPPDRGGQPPWRFRVSPFYMDPLSDQIPPERGHEVWAKGTPYKRGDYQRHRATMSRVVSDKLSAVLSVSERLAGDLNRSLTAYAPAVRDVLRRPPPLAGVPLDGQIIFQHARLLAAADRLEVDLLMAMPPHEREARYSSLRLAGTLVRGDRAGCLREMGLAHLVPDVSVHVFAVSERSRDVRMKDGDFLFSLMPEDAQGEMGAWSVAKFKQAFPAVQQGNGIAQYDWRTRLRDELDVQIVRLDRRRLRLVVKAGTLLRAAIANGIFDISFDATQGRFGIVDPLVKDFFTKAKLRPALQAIKSPPVSRVNPLFADPAISRVRPLNPRVSEHCPPADFIWDARRAARQPSGRAAEAIERLLDPKLTPRQREAVVSAATQRLTIWWGPPGTGKSATAVALLSALVADARKSGRGLRIAVTGHTWIAIDNVLAKVPQALKDAGFEDVRVARLASAFAHPGDIDPRLREHVVVAQSSEFIALGGMQNDRGSIVLIGSTADQLFKLGGDGLAPCFDVMLIDEASQMDVAHAIVAFTKLAPDASVVVVGDDRQMPPIHKIDPPTGAAHLLGSIYDFYAAYRGASPVEGVIPRVMLDRSFRSNREIIEFVREAGYGPDLHSANPGLRIAFARPATVEPPSEWPKAGLEWSPQFDSILNPDEPLVAIVNPDRYSSQRNPQEADLVASLVLRLYQRGLMDLEMDSRHPYPPERFFEHGVGVVTPHRAQQAAVLDRLLEHMPEEAAQRLYASVDTVERFQGQEKAVMIATFGLGDADQIGAEEEFLYSLNRFNVIASRARAKLIVLMSRRLVDHLPRERETLVQSRLLKHFADGYLRRSVSMLLPGFEEACEVKFR